MDNNLKSVIVLNGPMMVKVDGDLITINAYQNEVKIPYNPKDNPDSIKRVVDHRKEGLPYEITSDLFDCVNLNFKEKNLERDVMLDIFHQLLEASVQFIAKISKEENIPVLIQNSYIENSSYFFSTIGLIDDTRITFAEITPSTKKRVRVKKDV